VEDDDGKIKNRVLVEENWLMVFGKENMMGNYMGLSNGMFILVYIVELAKIILEYIGIPSGELT